MPIIDDKFIDSNDELIFYFLKLAADEIHPWLQDYLLVVFLSERLFYCFWMIFQVV